MTGKGSLTYAPNLRLRVMLAFHITWLALVCLLGGWWGRVMFRQSNRIADLSRAAGVSVGATDAEWARTQRMLYGESTVFFGLLLATTLLLFWLYWRDVKRARGLEAFFASVTHELKTPLTSIRLQAESISDGAGGPVVIGRLLEDTIRLEAQVERTLELARVEGGGQVSSQPVSLKPWLDQFLREWRSAHAGVVEVQAEQLEDFAIEADPRAMYVILRNLLENSARHARRTPVTVTISSKEADGGVNVIVQDNGPGFSGPTRDLGRIFIKGPGSQGAGVGLYLVKTLMARMGGHANFETLQGFRTSLWFRAEAARPSNG
jgi:signal transduction histidine kinase